MKIRDNQEIEIINGQARDCSDWKPLNKLFKFPKNFNIFQMQPNEVVVYPSNHIIKEIVPL